MPAFEEVLGATLAYYGKRGKTREDGQALLDRVAAEADEDGKAHCGEMKARWTSPPTTG